VRKELILGKGLRGSGNDFMLGASTSATMDSDHQTPPPYPVSALGPYSRKTSGLAVTSLVLGILSMMGAAFFFIPPLLAVVFGHIAVSSCGRDPNLDGKGLAIAGLVMGWICLAGWILLVLFFGGLAALFAFAASMAGAS